MTDKMRWRYGDTKPVVSKAVPTDTVIEIGDLTAVDGSSNPIPAADIAWDTDLATTQEAFHDAFLGVSAQRSRDGDIDPVRCNTSGVHEFDCAAATFELGDLVGPAKAAGNALLSQTVVAVAGANLAVGRVAKRYASNTTTVLVEIVGTVQHGGPQAPA